jgi:hypothetical protein
MDILAQLKPQPRNKNHVALCRAIVNAYCRPFTRSAYGNRLGPEIVPEEFKDLHSAMLSIRHKGAAHTDGNPEIVAAGRPLNAVYIEVKPDGDRLKVIITGSKFTLDESALIKIGRLMGELEKKSEYYVKKIRERYKREWPQDVGHFMLNVNDDTRPMWLRTGPPVSWGSG